MSRPSPLPLRGTRILSLALNLPGPAALMRCRAMGATCVKLEPVAPGGQPSADPMSAYCPPAYAQLHEGVRRVAADLKTPSGQKRLQSELARADVLITSFRPSALARLGLDWARLRRAHPQLSLVMIVGAPGERAEEPGHDLTYLAENDLVTGLALPPTLYADMGGSLMASEAVLKALWLRQRGGRGVRLEVALSEAAAYLGLPRRWGLTQASGTVGGAHAGYAVYACRDGRVALAALEPHFARALCEQAGLPASAATPTGMARASTRRALTAFFQARSRRELDALARAHDLPLHTLPA
jgi:crotonobetainyl-CoA:carnitine CoA-transferase CaiB-like acyl-CoA transferase